MPAFASGLDQREAVRRYFMHDGAATVDAVVSLTGFSLVGGPAYNDAHAAETMLAALDVPYIAAHPVEFQTLEQWQGDPRGLLPVEATMMVAIPELDGAIRPMTFGGRSLRCRATTSGATWSSTGERTAMLAARVARLVALRPRGRAPSARSRSCCSTSRRTPGRSAPPPICRYSRRCSTRCAHGGCRLPVDVPDSVDALRDALLVGNTARFGADANVAARMPADDHVRRAALARPRSRRNGARRRAGTRPTARRCSSWAQQFGNVFVGVQPAFGYEGDPMRLLFERGFAPTHAFCAFYRWIAQDFAADAVLHFGTHGALEFMPGKQAGLSGECWPDRLIGDLPNFYLYASNNPSEGIIAKRRSAATLISYLTPPVAHAGLYRGLLDLKASLDRWRRLPPDEDAAQRDPLASLIQAQAVAVDLAAAEPAWTGDDTEAIDRLAGELLALEYTLIPDGMHVVGETPDAEQRAAMLDAAGVTDAAERARLDCLLSTDHEIPAICCMRWTRGYLRPAPGGDLLRTTEVLPTGRNLHGFDPFRIPSAFAVRDGAQQAERLLARHREDSGALPETVAIVLWGTDNLKTEGGPIAQVLWLIGAEPRCDSYGRVAGARLLPLATLGRPRIDVVATLSGIFRDLLPLQTKLLAEAALLAAGADEPVGSNFVRKHALDFQAAHGGSIEDAALRVFGNADGAYGANVNHLVGNGAWQDEDELAEAFVRRKGFAYGASTARRGGTMRCCSTCWRAWMSPIRTSIRSNSA